MICEVMASATAFRKKPMRKMAIKPKGSARSKMRGRMMKLTMPSKNAAAAAMVNKFCGSLKPMPGKSAAVNSRDAVSNTQTTIKRNAVRVRSRMRDMVGQLGAIGGTRLAIRQLSSRVFKHRVEPCGGQSSRIRVLAARMIGADDRILVEAIQRIVSEFGARVRNGDVVCAKRLQNRVEPHRAQTNQYAHKTQPRKSARKIGQAIRQFLTRRFVVRRRAARGSADVHLAQLQTIAARNGMRLIGKARAIQRGKQKIAGAVARQIPHAITPSRYPQ